MNFRHLITLPGILKLVALVVCLLAASIGASAFVTSAYNKSCSDGTFKEFAPNPSTDDSITITTEATTLRTRTPGTPVSPISSTTSISTSGSPQAFPLASSEETTTDLPLPEYKDMAPVLWMERFQISITWLSFVTSVVLLLLYVLMESMETNKFFKAVNFMFHFIFCVLLITSAIFLAFAAIEIDRQICEKGNFDKREDCQKYMQKMSAAAFTLLGGLLYGVICVRLIATKLYEKF